MGSLRFLKILFLILLAPTTFAAPAGLIGTASLIPGLGQLFNGNALEALGWFSSTIALYSSGSATARQIGFDLWMYNMYDAYRDAKPSGSKYSNESFLQNEIAAFNPANIIDPIGAPIVAWGAFSGRGGGYPALTKPVKILEYSFVGLGEEALFRGFLFPSFSDVFDSKIVGGILSSAAFSYVHVTNGATSRSASALIYRFIAGLVFAFQADRNKYDLRKNIFAHAWYDIFVDDGGPVQEVVPMYGVKIYF